MNYESRTDEIKAALSNARTSGTWFLEALAILFIGLKLTHVIDWSWWRVLSPLWSGPALILVVVVPVIIVCSLVRVFSK